MRHREVGTAIASVGAFILGMLILYVIGASLDTIAARKEEIAHERR